MEHYEPRLSIVIPTLQEAGFLRQTVEHLFKAAKAPDSLEVIVVDAGSTDKTRSTIEGFPIRWVF